MALSLDEIFSRSPLPFHTSISHFRSPNRNPVPFSISNLLPIGLTLLSGASRQGKTSLALHLAYDVFRGIPALNSHVPTIPDSEQPYATMRGRVHYLALDSSTDTIQQLTDRLFAPTENLDLRHFYLTNTLEPLTLEGGLLNLCANLASPDVRLLVIDNLACVRKLFEGTDHELLDLLRQIAEQTQTSILLLHTCKRSSPLATHVDHQLHLTRLPIASYYQLESLTRKHQPSTLLLHCPPEANYFRIVTLAEETSLCILNARKVLSPERITILDLLQSSQRDLTPRQIAATLNLDYDCVRQILSKMVSANLLTTSERGHYIIHPFIHKLLPALLAHTSLIPRFSLSAIPPDEEPAFTIPHNLPPAITHSPPPSATSHKKTQAISSTSHPTPDKPISAIAHNEHTRLPLLSASPEIVTHNPTHLPDQADSPISHNPPLNTTADQTSSETSHNSPVNNEPDKPSSILSHLIPPSRGEAEAHRQVA
ncbi:AAA family ATPase [Ktedonospora formicarum]|uniref:Uncharacterized protein n=1 Tax=Ktedonospora formicarum TaxID=2778364 RepID=A0A8J3IEZ7_9CHLR|nr:AAA family ATPase [Ktedonospora formicarum]GHO50004.1 hypothetical protein KSX_81670 [Ktedonospora formicarum]